MIVLGKSKILDDYFIDENGVITDKNGVIQETYIIYKRPYFKSIPVHRILMYTFKGYRDGYRWVIHHLDGNKLNNTLNNLVYLTRAEHSKLHGKNMPEEMKKKMSKSHKGHIPWNKGKVGLQKAWNKGKTFSEESKIKMKDSHLGRIWVNNGIINKHIFPNEIPNGFVRGRL